MLAGPGSGPAVPRTHWGSFQHMSPCRLENVNQASFENQVNALPQVFHHRVVSAAAEWVSQRAPTFYSDTRTPRRFHKDQGVTTGAGMPTLPTTARNKIRCELQRCLSLHEVKPLHVYCFGVCDWFIMMPRFIFHMAYKRPFVHSLFKL